MTQEQKVKSAPSPTFVAKFEDGIVTRMTVHGGEGRFDLARAVELALIAYESRTGQRPPRLAAGKFVQPNSYDEVVLKDCSLRVLELKQCAMTPEQTTKEAAT